MEMLSVIGGHALTVFIVVALFGLTVFVHELGHFLVARLCGMVVDTFSIGFGPPLWQRKVGDVVYKIGVFPIGGYVALPQMDPGGALEHPGDATARPLPPASPGKRILVSFAGAAMNILLAFLIASGFYFFSEHKGEDRQRTVVGFVRPDSRAEQAGLRVGDRILRINGEAVRSWDDVLINAALSDEARLDVAGADGIERTLTLATEPVPGHSGRTFAGVGKASPCLVIGTEPASPAERAGVRRGDIIEAFDGAPVYGTDDLIARIMERRDQDALLTIRRRGERVDLPVRPEYNAERDRVMIGIHFNQFDYTLRPAAQVWAWAAPVFRIFRAFGSPAERSKAAGALSGPVGILRIFWMAAATHLVFALWLTGLINVNLAIFNLLPIPILDGGHIMFALYEAIRRRPPGAAFLSWTHRIFAALLLGLIVLLTLRDVRQMVRRAPADEAAAESAPAPAAPPEAAP